ncbi:aerotolerance regulator BatC, partial [bacterium]|nr:aerotolerance regulator BatC [bacterium]
QEQQQEQAQEQQVSPDDLSKEDAARILEALKEDPQNLSDNRKLKSSGRMRVEKDW